MEQSSERGIGIDVIGDVHGQYSALVELLTGLGYDAARDWRHPDGRRLLFLGDLIDRGPASLEVATLVWRLCADREHLCLMGNHELNLVEWRRGRTGPKSSNRPTIDDVKARPEAWAPVLDFFETLPLAVELSKLRVTHAAWHSGCFEQLAPALRAPSASAALSDFWRAAIVLHAPFEHGNYRPGVPTIPYPGQWEKSLEIFVKGHETKAPRPFKDNDGHERDMVRAEWWRPEHDAVPKDKRIVFGHYWNLPPVRGYSEHFVPPHPSGHPDLRRWAADLHVKVDDAGAHFAGEDVGAICVDYNGLTKASPHRACVGAYRHPEAQVVWRTTSVEPKKR